MPAPANAAAGSNLGVVPRSGAEVEVEGGAEEVDAREDDTEAEAEAAIAKRLERRLGLD